VSYPLHPPARAPLLALLPEIVPGDDLEREHLERTRSWVASGADLYRRGSIDVPPIHLVVYFAPLTPDRRQLLLAAHRKAGLWLPPGGHVEPGEHPWTTVTRECAEELHLPATPSQVTGPAPAFVTVTRTRNRHPHTDVTLWFPLETTPEQITSYDSGEFTRHTSGLQPAMTRPDR
jgi:8-oxo-dGTP pyrophosphatase MutT (NUDIX family)